MGMPTTVVCFNFQIILFILPLQHYFHKMALTKSDEDTLKKKLKFEHSLFAIITLFLVSYKVHLHSLSFISLRQSMQTREYVGCFPSCVNTTTRLGQSFNVERANSLRKCTPIFKNPLGALHPVHSTAR